MPRPVKVSGASGRERRERTPAVQLLQLVPLLRTLPLLPDSKGQSVDAVREIRDEIRRRVEALVQSEGWARKAE